MTPALEGDPPLLVRNPEDPATERLERDQFGVGCRIRHHRRAGHAQLPGPPGDALGHVAGTGRDDPGGNPFGQRFQQGIPCPAQLEGPDRMEVLTLEVNRRLANRKRDHGSHREVGGQPVARRVNPGQRHLFTQCHRVALPSPPAFRVPNGVPPAPDTPPPPHLRPRDRVT